MCTLTGRFDLEQWRELATRDETRAAKYRAMEVPRPASIVTWLEYAALLSTTAQP